MTTDNLINSEVSVESDSSLSVPELFQFVVRGEVLTENEELFFQVENGLKLKVKQVIPDSYPTQMGNWQAIPTTDNDGKLMNIILEKPLSESGLRTKPQKILIEAGRIVEVAKKGGRIKVKVKRQERKDLKISVLSNNKKMKIGQLWSMEGIIKEGYFHIQQAKYIQD